MSVSAECQKKFISNLIENQTTVSIYLKHGIKLTGKIVSEAEGVIFLSEPIPQMIYKSSVSTIAPHYKPLL